MATARLCTLDHSHPTHRHYARLCTSHLCDPFITTSPFQRAHRLMPHKSLRQKHGPGNECIVGRQKRLEAAARLRPASAKCHTNLNGRNTAHSSKFHSSLTAALRLKPASSSPDAKRDSSAAVILKLQLSPFCGIVIACYGKLKR